jgi:hypothetical protein
VHLTNKIGTNNILEAPTTVHIAVVHDDDDDNDDDVDRSQ